MDLALSPQQRDLIVARMRQLRMSQKELGVVLGIGQERVSDKLGGRRLCEPEEVALIGTVLMLPAIIKAAGVIPRNLSEKTWEMVARAFITHLRRMQPHDRREALFGVALTLESKRPYGESPETKFLRALAALTPVAMPSHPFVIEPKASKSRTAKSHAPEPHVMEPQLV